MAWQTPKTDWTAADGVTDDDLNRIEGNIDHIENSTRTPNDAVTPAASGPLATILSYLVAMIKKITGKTSWYTSPSVTLEDCNTHINASAPHSGHAPLSHTHSGSDITSAVANADTLDGYHASSFVLTSNYEDADVLAKIKNVDGVGSGLDADKIRGRVISSGTADPSGGSDGDIYFQYEA